ncbi:MAG: hypothetical protein ACLFTA_03680 [Candidatus Nanohaloarchaea archaeon]
MTKLTNRRLEETEILLKEAKKAHENSNDKRRNTFLRYFVVAGRSVTFVMQKEKSGDDFQGWYKETIKQNDSEIADKFQNLRNIIEKEGRDIVYTIGQYERGESITNESKTAAFSKGVGPTSLDIDSSEIEEIKQKLYGNNIEEIRQKPDSTFPIFKDSKALRIPENPKNALEECDEYLSILKKWVNEFNKKFN